MCLASVDVRSHPFEHFVGTDAVQGDVAESLGQWLEHRAPWTLHREHFFEQYECDLLDPAVHAPPVPLLASTGLVGLRRRMETIFRVELADRVTVFAHKLVPGQGIGVHNDSRVEDGETHRLVLHLTRDWRDDDGGYLVLFTAPHPDAIARILRPLYNTAVGFAISQHSYHAVTDVSGRPRYSVTWSFWERAARA